MEILTNEQLDQLVNDPENLKKEIGIKMKGVETHLNELQVARQRDSLILSLAAELNSYKWVQQHYPAFYEHCLKSV